MLYVPMGSFHVKHTVKRSLFIGDIDYAGDRQDAENIIRARRERYTDANHVVYAVVTGGERSLQFGMSDDGEPHGTAGRPILDVLKGAHLTSVVLTVTRYFGGTKLGTGGLVRAYQDTARMCVEGVSREVLRKLISCSADVPYALERGVLHVIREHNGEVVEQHHGVSIGLTFLVDEDNLERVLQAMRDVSRGTLDVVVQTRNS